MTTSPRRAALLAATLLAPTAACGGGPSRVGSTGDQVVLSQDLERSPEKPIEQVLQEKLSGVTVTRTPDGALAVRIRGITMSGDDAPLYILDNLPFQPGPEGALSGVDPYSIESIRVLKGPEGAIYGMRGVNGVIIITTKKAGRRH